MIWVFLSIENLNAESALLVKPPVWLPTGPSWSKTFGKFIFISLNCLFYYRNAARLVVLYDMKACLFSEEVEEGEDQAQGGEQDEGFQILLNCITFVIARLANLEAVVLNSRNPVLEGIEQFLVEETNAEEETILEKVSTANNTDIMQEYEVDSQLAKVGFVTVYFKTFLDSRSDRSLSSHRSFRWFLCGHWIRGWRWHASSVLAKQLQYFLI